MRRMASFLVILGIGAVVIAGETATVRRVGRATLGNPSSYELADRTPLTFCQRNITSRYVSVGPQANPSSFSLPKAGDKVSGIVSVYVGDQDRAQLVREQLTRDEGSRCVTPSTFVTHETKGGEPLIEQSRGFDRYSPGWINYQGTVAKFDGEFIELSEITYSVVELDSGSFKTMAKQYWLQNEDSIRNMINAHPDIWELFTGKGRISVDDLLGSIRGRMEDEQNQYNLFDGNYCPGEDLVELSLNEMVDLWREEVDAKVTSCGIGVHFLFKREPQKLQEVSIALSKARMRTVAEPRR